MKAFLTASFDAPSRERLERIMPVHVEDWRVTKHLFFDGAEFARRIREEGCDVVVVEADLVHREVIEGVDLEMIGVCRGDPVNVDVALATERGIPVFHTPARNADAVADLTLCFMLMIARHVRQGVDFVRGKDTPWSGAGTWHYDERRFESRLLTGQTVLLLGFGAIGRRVARRVQAFGSRVVAFDPHLPDAVFEEAGVERDTLDGVVEQADFLSIHVPDVPETRGMVGAAQIARMKPGAYFVNTARAAAVEEEPLYQALASGRIRAAAFDVMWNEPASADDRFVRLDNVIVTPHVGGATHDVIAHQGQMICDSIEAWLAGRRPPWLANPAVFRGPSA